jgi:hypothetical protein
MINNIICWWSGGITSAVACKLAIDIFGKDNCRVIMIDTDNEHPDTYRFKDDCEKWYDIKIETITSIGIKYNNIIDVWRKYKSLNAATGAICSTELKRYVREDWQKNNVFKHQVFGFEFENKEFSRAKSMELNHPDSKGIYPLLMYGYDKNKCIEIIQNIGIEVPMMYKLGFKNNNCFGKSDDSIGGCVQGGIGYWQKMKVMFPKKFNAMADLEHELTDMRGEPVTMLKDQSNIGKAKDKSKKENLMFLKKHPNYPNIICIDDKAIQEVKPIFECNGFCGVNDLIKKNDTEKEINYE